VTERKHFPTGTPPKFSFIAYHDVTDGDDNDDYDYDNNDNNDRETILFALPKAS
jgi:hypothetical protein